MFKRKIIIISTLLIMVINLPCLARYYKSIKCAYVTKIAYPIVRLDSISNIVEDSNYNKTSQEYVYIFEIKNYYVENER